MGRPTGSGLSPTSPFQLVSLHLLSIQFVLAILLAGFMMMFKKKDDWHCRWLLFFSACIVTIFWVSQKYVQQSITKSFVPLSYPAQCQAIVTEIILIYLLVGAIAAKHFWYVEDFFKSELPMYRDAPKIRLEDVYFFLTDVTHYWVLGLPQRYNSEALPFTYYQYVVLWK